MEIEEIALLKQRQKEIKADLEACVRLIGRTEQTLKDTLSRRKARLLLDGITPEAIGAAARLEDADPEIQSLRGQLESLAARRRGLAEQEFQVASEIAKILS